MCRDSAVFRESIAKAGAPANEIEITPEMIEAGVSALASYDPGFGEHVSDFAVRIYRVMENAKKLTERQGGVGGRLAKDGR